MNFPKLPTWISCLLHQASTELLNNVLHKQYIPIMIFYYGQSAIDHNKKLTSHVKKHTDGNLYLNDTK